MISVSGVNRQEILHPTYKECFAVVDMHSLIHWLMTSGSLLALIVTLGVAVLLVCCLGCAKCPCREKDDIFSRHEV